MKKPPPHCAECNEQIPRSAQATKAGAVLFCARCASPRAKALRSRRIFAGEAAVPEPPEPGAKASPLPPPAPNLRKITCKGCGTELLAPVWDKGPLCPKCLDAAVLSRAPAGRPNPPPRFGKSKGKERKGGKPASPPMPISRPAPPPPPCAYCNPLKAAKAAVSLKVNRPICGPCRERLLNEARARGVGVGPGGLCPGCGQPRSLVVQESRPKLCNTCPARLDKARAAHPKRPPNARGIPDERPQSTSVRAWHGGAPGLGKRS